MGTGFEAYWYVVAESRELPADRVLARCVLGERLACFRGAGGVPAVLRDRCLHRSAPLSAGRVSAGRLSCAYHGWTYDGSGRVVAIPSIGTDAAVLAADGAVLDHCSHPYPVAERDGYVYVRLEDAAGADAGTPFALPHWREPGWVNLRLQNRFQATVANCVENFIDIPHTAFVHRSIFRSARGERLTARVSRTKGEVHVRYSGERANLGRYRWFLNPGAREIRHTDSYHAPNVTSVSYELGRKTFIITSQAVPVGDAETLVYTDLTYDFGALGRVAAPLVRRHAQRIIDQDVAILAQQQQVIARGGGEFRDTPADAIHACVESIHQAIARGEDPRALPPLEFDIEFRV